ncbi:GIY-YIG nuclease family protein [Tolypothrix bouteillei VB521301_2]|uniref:GIY-YIG nuclease family protein n=1 Tax=Tolypothrix bouteillei TaxID=1246981 RepID=UPI000512B31A
MAKNKDFSDLLTELLQEQSRPISSHDPGYIYLIKAVGFHGIVPGFYLGRYKIGLSRDPIARLENFYDNQPPCDLEIVRAIEVRDMRAVESILHKQFQTARISLNRKRKPEWFDLNPWQFYMVQRAFSCYEKHPVYGTVASRQLPKSISIVLILASLLALSVAGNYFISEIPSQQLNGSGLTEKDGK